MQISSALRKTAAAAALLLGCGASHALDLVDSYQKALRHDPSMLAAGEAVLAGREHAVQGDALLLPQLSLQAGYRHIEDRTQTDLPPAFSGLFQPDSSGQMHQVALKLTQPLYDARAMADRSQLHARTDLAELSYRNARQDLMQRVSEAYFQVLLAQENLRVVEAERAAVGMQRERAQARFEVGRGRITEVQETQARYDGVLTREVSAQSALALRQAQYRELTGAPAEGLAGLRAGFAPQPPQPDSLQAWQQKGLERNARVLAKRSELDIAAAEVGKHKLSGRPRLELEGGLQRRGQNGGLSPLIAADSNEQATLGVQLTLPLFAGGALDSRERESLAKKREAEHELGAAQRDMRLQVQDAYLAVRTGVARIAALEQSVLSGQTALEATTLGRDVGSRTELDVLDAQQRLYALQRDLAQARHDYLLGRIRLAYASGELEERHLLALNAELAP